MQQNLKKRGFIPRFFADEKDANDYILEIIPKTSTVGFGGSETVKEIGIAEALGGRGNELFYREHCKSEEEKAVVLKKIHTADWFICSTNALAESGDFINIDGRANRVAEMLYGPENVLIVLGVNKITPDIESGIDRVRNIAAPKNCVRLNKRTPCAVTGKCAMCLSPDTICKATVIQHHPTTGKNVYVVIINKELGY